MAETTLTPREWHGVDPGFAADFSRRIVDAWNTRQADQVLGLMTDDVDYHDASWPTRMCGHIAVREFLDSTWRAVPDLSFQLVENVLLDPTAPKIADYWRATGTHSGLWDPPGLAPTARRLEFEGAFLAELRDGKACRIRVEYDVAGVMRQLGVLPPVGSWGERALISVTNLQSRLRRR